MSEDATQEGTTSAPPTSHVNDILGGIVLPVSCLLVAPILAGYLGQLLVFVYVAAFLFAVLFTLWLVFEPWPSLFTGVLYAGTAATVVVGIAFFPFLVLTLAFAAFALPLALVGIFLGVSLILTTWVFLRNAERARRLAERSFRLHVAVLGFVVSILIPTLIYLHSSRFVARSLEAILHGDSAQATAAATELEHSILFVDSDTLVREYRVQADPTRQRTIADAYAQITGRDIEVALRILED